MKAPRLLLTAIALAFASTLSAAPDPQEILNRYANAVGGEKAIRAIKSREISGEFKMPAMNLAAKMSVKAKAPNLYLSKVEIEGAGTFIDGFDGKTAWNVNPMAGGLREKSAIEMPRAKRQADFYRDAELFKQYASWKVLEPATINGKPAKVLEGKGDDGATDKLHFDDESGLLVRIISSFTDAEGPKTMTTNIGDYRAVDGVKVAHKIEGSDGAGLEFVIEYTSVKTGVEIPDSVFKMEGK